MNLISPSERRSIEQLDSAALRSYQLARLNQMLSQILPQNRFYADKLGQVKLPLADWQAFQHWPYTFKEELQSNLRPGLAADHWTYPLERYVRYHQTSGSQGRPLPVLDTAEDWKWWLNCWQYVLDAAEVTEQDRLLLAFSFGPFIGFWSAHDAAVARGCLVVPGGGLTSLARLQLIRQCGVTVLFCTPSYALHLAEVGREHQINTADLPVRCLILAGEPGGSVPATRQRLEQAWEARVFDHSGASEVGPWGFADAQHEGLFVNEAEFLPEFLSVANGHAAAAGELSELVLTNLGRYGFPIIRYRTGDLVRPRWLNNGPIRFVHLEGGVLGRADDMLIVRGVNVFPSAIEHILLSFPEVREYRLIATRTAEMDQLKIEIEDQLNQPARVAEELRLRLSLRVEVTCVPAGSLPRFEGKAKRFVDQRHLK